MINRSGRKNNRKLVFFPIILILKSEEKHNNLWHNNI